MEEGQIAGTRGTFEREQKFKRDFGGETRKKETIS